MQKLPAITVRSFIVDGLQSWFCLAAGTGMEVRSCSRARTKPSAGWIPGPSISADQISVLSDTFPFTSVFQHSFVIFFAVNISSYLLSIWGPWALFLVYVFCYSEGFLILLWFLNLLENPTFMSVVYIVSFNQVFGFAARRLFQVKKIYGMDCTIYLQR